MGRESRKHQRKTELKDITREQRRQVKLLKTLEFKGETPDKNEEPKKTKNHS